MKQLLLFFVFHACFMQLAFAQKAAGNLILKLVKIVNRECLSCGNGYVTFDPAKKLLELDNLLIPLSSGTMVKYEKGKKSTHTVGFYMQQNTAIIDRTKPGIPYAWYSFQFKTRQACEDFVTVIEELKKEVKG